MIKACIARLFIAGVVAGIGVLLNLEVVNLFGVIILGIGVVWGILELFILSALLFMYGITGIAHDIGASQDHDAWGRW